MLLVSVSRDNGTAPNVWLKNLSDGSEQKVSFGDVLDYSPAFVSAGAAIAFVSPRDYQNWDLYRQPLDGKSALEKILDRPGDIQDPDFSPGEQSVAFTERDIKGQSDVRVHHFGPEPRTEEVWASSANEFGARFSPDGNFIAFVSDETGRPEVYVVPYPNPNRLRRPISTEGGGAPAWSRRGDELFYRTPDDDLVAVHVNTQGAFSPGRPERLFNLNKMQWTRTLTPDDNFILIHQDLRAPGQVILVKNWLQEVLRKMEGK
jgi:Tol biopolymer transport system component